MGNPIWKGSVGLIEQVNSPQWRFTASGVTAVRTWRGPYALCLSSAPQPGAVGVVDGFTLPVAESSVQKEKGRIGVLTATYQADGEVAGIPTVLPEPDAHVTNEKQERPLKKHPRYATVTESLKAKIDDLLGIKETDSDYAGAKAVVQANALAWELYLKLRSGHVSYSFYTPVYRTTEYYWILPVLTVGGFRQTPPSVPIAPPTGSSLGTLHWLREGDQVSWQGSYWQVTRSWIAGPDLDTDIYPLT